MAKLHASKRQGKSLEPICEKRWGQAPCMPINRYWILSKEGRFVELRRSCACGKRFKSPELTVGYARRILEKGLTDLSPSTRESVDPSVLWDETLVSRFGKIGVVPVGVPILHSPTSWYYGARAAMSPLADRMLRTMHAAQGIGLAANQVGAGVRVLAHNIPECAPPVLINPQRISAQGAVVRSEGCLSLNVDDSRGEVVRWKKITLVADLLDGNRVVLEADEMLARVLQHELDHLDGIEYVQRMNGQTRDCVYKALDVAQVPVDCLPEIGPEVELKWQI